MKKKKSQSLLDGQGAHPPEVGVAQDRGNSPGSDLRMRKQNSSSLAASKRSRFPVTSSGIVGGGAAPCDVGLQTEIGRTSKGGSSALPEESLAPTTDEGEGEALTFEVLPQAGGQPDSCHGRVIRNQQICFLCSSYCCSQATAA